ncbi:MAG: methyl-accepting chemotaxis protein [Clostridiales bacterium]|nr:methyl-accepting chemotaxis protein [Clostridiales bacterium]
MFRNMLIRTKLIVLAAILLFFTLLITIIAYVYLQNMVSQINHTYQSMEASFPSVIAMKNAFSNVRAYTRDVALSNDVEEEKEYQRMIESNMEAFRVDMEAYLKYLTDNNLRQTADYENMAVIRDQFSGFKDLINQIIEAGFISNNEAEVLGLIKERFTPISNDIRDMLGTVQDDNIAAMRNAGEQLNGMKQTASMVLLTAFLIALALAIALSYYIISQISKPMRKMLGVAQDLAKGNLNVNIVSDSKDEIGQFADSFRVLVDTLRHLMNDLSLLAAELNTNGDIDFRLDASRYAGSYHDIVENMNQMAAAFINDILLLLSSLQNISEGDFDFQTKRLAGKKAIVNDSLDKLTGNLTTVTSDIKYLVKAVNEGSLSVRVDEKRYKGDWADIIVLLDSMMEAVAQPINETAAGMQRIAHGDFSAAAMAEHQGDFNKIITAVNSTQSNISSYIGAISNSLNQLASNNLDQQITQEFVGEFTVIKDSLNNIFDALNQVMFDIDMAAAQVADGSKQISESSMTLAEGASEQAASVQELTATMTTLNEKTQQSAENARRAENLSLRSKENAVEGNEDMKNMVDAMEGIREASANISKIIKVIDDIAFQTNLLALNASVEAARAGEHGKGFAVVAGEVRNLAAKSMQAAQETTALIEDTVNRVNQGMSIAERTEGALSRIVDGVTEVSGIITEIAMASDEQAVSFAQINVGTNQISEVVQRNSSTSEETASAAQQLSSQSEILRGMISAFKLRGAKTAYRPPRSDAANAPGSIIELSDKRNQKPAARGNAAAYRNTSYDDAREFGKYS